jgi:serine/threonine-protein kinase
MGDDLHVRGLLEEVIGSRRSPEDVCAEHPELLSEVRRRWARCRRLEADLEAIFPPPQAIPASRAALPFAPEQLPQIPGYDVEAVLGRGGMGLVYKARHLKLNRRVAIKTILGGAYARASELERLTREAVAVAKLRHPNIVQVHDVGDLDGLPYYTMEYVEGGTLGQWLAGVPQPPRRAAELVAKLGRAVQTAHDKGIVHRDLKPANVLLTSDGTPKIADFGLAQQSDEDSSLTLIDVRVGTPSYMAPEQAAGDSASVGPSADVYALGAILYELLTGRPPFRAATATETLQQVVGQEPAPPRRLNAKVPRDVETICLKCLQKEPGRRYATAAALVDDLTRFVDGCPIAARPPSWAGRVRRWSRREPVAAGLAAMALCLAAVVIGGGFWLQHVQSERRADVARREGRTWQAVEASLVQAATLQAQGRWPEARAALRGAPELLGASAPREMSRRLRQARNDADVVADLESIRLPDGVGKGRGPSTPSVDQLYARAFRRYGVDLEAVDASEASARVRHSPIRDTLVAYLNDWLIWASQANREKLRDLVDECDPDEWRRAVRSAMAAGNADGLRTLSAAAEAPGQPPVILSGLANALVDARHAEAAQAMLREAQQRHPGDFWINYQLGQFAEGERPQEAIGYLRAAVAIRPGSDQAHTLLGRALRDAGDIGGAEVAVRNAFELNPAGDGKRELVTLLASQNRLRDLLPIWEVVLDRAPPSHDAWYGYAQLCLFMGDDQAYRRGRSALLDRFGEGADEWTVAERTSLAGLLLPDDGADLHRAIALADRVVEAAPKPGGMDNPYLLFLKGLAEFRRGRAAEAIPFVQAAAERLPNRPGPRLVLAMAQSRTGQPEAARGTLAVAVRNYDWGSLRANHPTAWVNHVLRREAESLVLPDLAAFLHGAHRPRDNDERLALAGACQARGFYAAAAGLFADAFAADPGLAGAAADECVRRAGEEGQLVDRAEALDGNCRYVAARCAALASCGFGADAPTISDPERTRWRAQARAWLRAELEGWDVRVRSDDGLRGLEQEALLRWRDSPDLTGVRDASRMNGFAAEERDEWLALWRDVGAALAVHDSP